MNSILRVTIVIFTILFLMFVIQLVAKKKLLLRYSLIWLALGCLLLICALFPDITYVISNYIGFINPSNFIILVGLAMLLCISLSLSLIVSKQSNSIKNLTQQIALLENLSDKIIESEGKSCREKQNLR